MDEVVVRATIESVAIKSDCGKHRFVLSRIWNRMLPVGAFLCANPSKADELRSDQTVFKCGNLAANWSWGGFHLVNLYPNYSTDPNGVVRDGVADRLNERHVTEVVENVDMVVIACGNGHAGAGAERDDACPVGTRSVSEQVGDGAW